MRDRRKPRVNPPRSVPARERNPEFVAFGDSIVRLLKNEIRGVVREILRPDNLGLSFHG